jgi:hypothetical protein
MGKFTRGEGNLGHRVLGQHDMRYDRAFGLSVLIGDLAETGDIDIGLWLAGSDQMTVRAEPFRQALAMHGVGQASRRAGEGNGRIEQQSSDEDDAPMHEELSRAVSLGCRLV